MNDSHDKNTPKNTPDESIGDANIDALLTHAADPPRLEDKARERIFAQLEDHLAAASPPPPSELARGSEEQEEHGTEIEPEADEPEPEELSISSPPPPSELARGSDGLPSELARGSDGLSDSDEPEADTLATSASELAHDPESQRRSRRASSGRRPAVSIPPAVRQLAFALLIVFAGLVLNAILFRDKHEQERAEKDAEEVTPLAELEYNEGGAQELPTPTGPIALTHTAPTPRLHTLRDGSTLTLRQGTRITEIAPRRLEIERGELLLDVVKGETPFTVTSPHGKTTVLGTRFYLATREEDTRVAVLKGRVQVHSDQGDATLRAGEEARLSPHGPPTRTPAPRLTHLTSWARTARAEDPETTAQPARKGALLARVAQWSDREWPLPMRALTVDAHVEDQIARVTLDQTFFNHTHMQLEGVYRLTLPAHAAVARLAMYVEGKRMEAGIVERQRARQIYEDIVFRRRDPALLEWMQGNRFQIRIFPLPARQEKRILLSYTQNLERLYDSYRIHIPMPEVDGTVGRVEMRVRIAGAAQSHIDSSTHTLERAIDGDDALVTFTATDHTLRDDLILTVHEPSTAPVLTSSFTEGAHRYLQARVRPDLSSEESTSLSRRWVVLNDTSASRTPLERKAQRFVLEQMAQAIDEDDLIAIVDFDTTPRHVLDFQRAGDLTPQALAERIDATRPRAVGHTDLKSAFDHALRLLENTPNDTHAPHILLLSDGIDTHISPLQLGALADALADRATVVSVALGATYDARTLRTLANRTGGYTTVFQPGEDLAWRCLDLVATLNTPRLLHLEAELLDAQGQPLPAPLRLSQRSIASGEELVAWNRSDVGSPVAKALRLSGTVAGAPFEQRFELNPTDTHARYLPRLWARAEIEALLDDSEAHQETITELGMTHWLMTPFTSLLVLETEAMYAQYEVNRGSDDAWARYDAPESIEVHYEPAQASNLALNLEGVLVRRPKPFFQPMGLYDYRSTVTRGFIQERRELDWGVSRNESTKTGEDLKSLGQGLSMIPTQSQDAFATSLRMPLSKTSMGPFRQAAAADPNIILDIPSVDAAQLELGARAQGGLVFSDNLSVLGNTRYYSPHYGTPYPALYQQLYDTSLNDLSAFAPGMFSDGYDLARDALVRNGVAATGSISAQARARIEKARARLERTRFVDDTGARLTLLADGAFRLENTSGATPELQHYDGRKLHHIYPELGLFTTRIIDVTEPALLAQRVPFLLARPDHLARFYHVSIDGDDLVLQAADAKRTVRITLDGADRVTAIRRYHDGVLADELTLSHDADGAITAHSTLGTRTWSTASEEAASAATDGFVELEMPLRDPEHWRSALAGEQVGSARWRHLQHQTLASILALESHQLLPPVLLEMTNHAPLSRGELILASPSIPWLEKAQLNTFLSAADADIASYLRAMHALHHESNASAFSSSPALEPGLLGMLRDHRVFLEAFQNGRPSFATVSQRHNTFRSRYDFTPMLYVQVVQIMNHFRHEEPEAVIEMLEAVASQGGDGLGRIARLEIARTLYNQGEYARAAEAFNADFEAELEAGRAPIFTYEHYYSLINGTTGQAAWRLFWMQWKLRVSRSDELDQHIALINALAVTGQHDEIDALLAQLPSLSDASPEAIQALVQALVQYGRLDRAQLLLDGYFQEVNTPSPRMLMLAASVAESLGQNGRAAQAYADTLKALGQTPLPLQTFRSLHRKLITLYSRDALAGNTDARASALDWVEAWRESDPDNAEIDHLASRLLFNLGENDEAWRYLATIIERHPMQGDALAEVARALEGRAQLERAEKVWARAAEVEPTNPTWSLRRAQNLITQDAKPQAAKILEAITAREDWHERFEGEVAQAKALLTLVKAP